MLVNERKKEKRKKVWATYLDFSLFSLSLSPLSLLYLPPSMTDFLDAADDLERAQTREGFEDGER